MKRLLSSLLVFTFIFVSLFSISALADDTIHSDLTNQFLHNHEEVPVIYITDNTFNEMLLQSEIIEPLGVTCCDGSPVFSYKNTYSAHIWPSGGGICLGIAYFGDKYCVKCGSIWATNICYDQTGGCGRYHNYLYAID